MNPFRRDFGVTAWLRAFWAVLKGTWHRAKRPTDDWATFESHKDTERLAKLLGFSRDELMEAVQKEGWQRVSGFLRESADASPWRRLVIEQKPADEKESASTAAGPKP